MPPSAVSQFEKIRNNEKQSEVEKTKKEKLQPLKRFFVENRSSLLVIFLKKRKQRNKIDKKGRRRTKGFTCLDIHIFLNVASEARIAPPVGARKNSKAGQLKDKTADCRLACPSQSLAFRWRWNSDLETKANKPNLEEAREAHEEMREIFYTASLSLPGEKPKTHLRILRRHSANFIQQSIAKARKECGAPRQHDLAVQSLAEIKICPGYGTHEQLVYAWIFQPD